ncbi:hypothetical protein [Acetivibrio saccincola]|nr:hypothetical protein [Acetivibrio saccincola]NLW26352.1 hypothetical protein [Acetivibrio saccincola]PQQ67958.1 hypothetical protein B9R14_15105 [Acetivibrio saccincola]HOA96523.1 hypothetical protein [Acetivibrio saccincola]HQD28345.1 hypothetical protein [Acetivibrio saccincola]
MWTVVYMAQSKEVADNMQDLLSKEGILVKLRPINKNRETSDDYYEVLVPESEVEEAHSVIIEKGY